MKNILILFFVILLYGCTISHKSIINNDNLSGVYSVKYFPVLLTIDSNGTYLITNSIDRMEYFYRDNLCDTISTGEWSFSAPNIIDILRDNYYKKQRGFEYNLLKENRLSQYSLYIHANFSRDYLHNNDMASIPGTS